MTRRPILASSSVMALLMGVSLTACSGAPSGASASNSVTATATATAVAGSTAPAASPSATASPSSSANPQESLGPFACTLPIRGNATIARAQIIDLVVGTHASYDRIVFTFAAGLPQYTIEKASPPFAQDPSGLPISVQGSSFLRIVLHGGTVQLPGGGKSYSGATSYTPRFAKLVDLEAAGDFEAVASWYVGLNGDACVRVFALNAPSRLVIDLQH